MLTSLHELLRDAELRRYAVGAFNCISVENVVGAVRAAEALRSPIILQLAEVQFPQAPLELMVPVFLEAARRASVPVCVHLDHGQSVETCIRAIRLGVTSVMFDGASLPYEENAASSGLVSRIARASGVDTEAELGKVGLTGIDTADVFTDPDEALRFVKESGVDALAVAIGNLHGNYVHTPRLNIERLMEIHSRVGIPLVLHGGSGTSVEDFKACLQNGICKINVATAMHRNVARRIRERLAETPDPSYGDLKQAMIDASQETVSGHLLLFESDGKA